MGDHADDAINAGIDEWGAWSPRSSHSWWMRQFRYRALKREQRTNQVVFAAFIDKPVDPSQF